MDLESQDIRWQQRFENYRKALAQLNDAVALSAERELTNLEKQGLVKGFEYTYELAWNVMKDYFRYQGNQEIRGSRDAIRAAYQSDLVDDGHIWMKMIEDRNLSIHTYNQNVVEKIEDHILRLYIDEFQKFSTVMERIAKQQ
jgi:nucleotidyltransferase substrate binding protein (TIGR01987 family)